MPSKSEIQNAVIENSHIIVDIELPVVYFLIKDNEIVYIGKSINFRQRIAEHKTKKDFDRYTALQVSYDMLDMLESAFILQFHPKLNAAQPIYNGLSGLCKKIGFRKDFLWEHSRRWSKEALEVPQAVTDFLSAIIEHGEFIR